MSAAVPSKETPIAPIELSVAQPTRLRGNLGSVQLFFTVVAYNAPLAVVVGFIPVIIGFGNGLGAPVMLLVAGLIIGAFAVGFTAMSRHLDKPGGFYSYITAGLGRVVGLGSSFMATVSYYFALIGCYAFGGLALQSLVRDTFNGPNVTWWVWMLGLQAIAAVLGYFRLDLSARVLSVLLSCEIVVVLIYDACVAFKGGAAGLHVADSFTPHAVFSGSIGIALLFALTMFGGFESTAIFRDEVRRPHRTIPRTTYVVVAFIAVFYALCTLLFIQAYGAGHVVSATATNPTGSVLASFQAYGGRFVVDMATVLLNTSIFAAALSAHNITTRYFYNLSSDRILPKLLSQVHSHHGSPHRASIATSILALVGMAPMVIFKANPLTLYAILLGIYGYTLIAMLAVTSLAVLIYLRRHQPVGTTPWNSIITPIFAFIGLGLATYLGTVDFDVLIGGSTAWVTIILVGFYAVGLAGVTLAAIYRKTRPEVYARIGRQ